MTQIPTSAPPALERLDLEFLFLDLTECTRCRGADRNLTSALGVAHDLLAERGIEVEVRKQHVVSAEQARELRFETSPTIRVNGRDVALELRESACGSEPCTDGCGETIACRVWVHEGREYTEPPVAMIVDAIVREVDAPPGARHERESESYELPENLERFFAGRAEATGEAPPHAGCCSPAELGSCCDPGEKAECCGARAETGCGCR